MSNSKRDPRSGRKAARLPVFPEPMLMLPPLRTRPLVPDGGEENLCPDLLPVEPPRETAMARAKATTTTKSARAKTDVGKRLKQAQQAAIRLKQVSDPTRLQIILMLAEGEKHVGGLCEVLNQSQPATSHHLALLRHGGMIAPRRQGKNNFYALTEAGEQLASIIKRLIG